MEFAEGHFYHVYNRGNNSQTVFFTHENYLFFLEKIRKYMLPHSDILAWCLMPNHFHLMISVKKVEVEISEQVTSEQVTSDGFSEGFTSDAVLSEQVTLGPEFDPMTWAHRINNQEECVTHPMNSSHRMSSKESAKYRSLNDSIAIMLRSYTRAINKQYQKHGSLFEQHTKALCLTEPQGVSPAYFNTHFGMMGNLDWPETNYLNVCFDYIHLNPVYGRLVAEPEDWEFSSHRDYFCRRKGKLINRELAKGLGLIE